MSSPHSTTWNWLQSGGEWFPAMLEAIDTAHTTIRLEFYIFASSPLGETFRAALVKAQQRGVSVRVLVDAIGSLTLSNDFWTPLRDAGGDARFFNPVALRRFGIRNHRKLLVCDDSVAFIGGFNIAPEYEGDGILRGWRDIGLQISGTLVAELAGSFDEMFGLANFRHKRLVRFRRARLKRALKESSHESLLLGGPGRGRNPIKRALHSDTAKAGDIRIITGYFLPTGRLWRDLTRVARRGGSVQLILAGKSDVPLSQLAAQSLYRRLLKAGVQIYEYQPQILHAKLLIVDDSVYVGSANLDPRSLSINYELMIRFHDAQMAGEARQIFDGALQHCRRIEMEKWMGTRTFWTRLKRRWAYFILARIDPYIASHQWKSLPD